MKKLIQPYALLFYILTLLLFFLVGVSFAKISGAADGQMLAGAAIVLGYGLMAAIFALIVGIALVYRFEYPLIGRLNKIFGASLFLLISYYVWNYQVNVKPQRIEKSKIEIPTRETAPTHPKQNTPRNPN